MTNYEHYKDEIIEAIANSASCSFKMEYILKTEWCKIDCDTCDQCNSKTKEWFNSEYKEPIKLTQTERDILCAFAVYSSFKFEHYPPLMQLKEKGYFQNINVEMTIEELLKCEVVEDDMG